MINPSNGRQVWFRPNGCFFPNLAHLDQPLAATVVHVWNDRSVNLVVLDMNGVAHPFGSVQLLQDDDEAPATGFGVYAEWMPYQKGQAAAQTAVQVEVVQEPPKIEVVTPVKITVQAEEPAAVGPTDAVVTTDAPADQT